MPHCFIFLLVLWISSCSVLEIWGPPRLVLLNSDSLFEFFSLYPFVKIYPFNISLCPLSISHVSQWQHHLYWLDINPWDEFSEIVYDKEWQTFIILPWSHLRLNCGLLCKAGSSECPEQVYCSGIRGQGCNLWSKFMKVV